MNANTTPTCFGKYMCGRDCVSCQIDTARRCQKYTKYVAELDRVQTEAHERLKQFAKHSDYFARKFKALLEA